MCTQHPLSCRYSDSICRSICFLCEQLLYKTTLLQNYAVSSALRSARCTARLQQTINLQCPRNSHFTDCMYSTLRTKHPLMPRSMHVGLQRTISSQCRRYNHFTGMPRSMHVGLQRTISSQCRRYSQFHGLHVLCSPYEAPLDTRKMLTLYAENGQSPHNAHATAISSVACTPQSVQSTY